MPLARPHQESPTADRGASQPRDTAVLGRSIAGTVDSARSAPAKPAAPPPSLSPSPSLSLFTRECAAFFSEAVQVFGVPKSVGQIYGLLYASPEPLSFSDIVERLDISKGSASQGLQLLRSLGAINVANARGQAQRAKVEAGPAEAKRQAPFLPLAPRLSPIALGPLPPEASRREYYAPELSLRRLVSGVMQERISPLAATDTDRLGRLRELAKSDGEASDFYLDRVRQLETWRRRLRAVLPVLIMLLGPKNKR